MAIILKAKNSSLVSNAKYGYLSTNYASGVSSVVLTNSVGFSANDYILFGEFGNETSEIVQISSVTAATHTLALASATKFAHSESTKITIIPYNQIRFFRTTTATFASTNPLTDYIDIQADSLYTQTSDANNTTGFGWYIFHNSQTNKQTSNSNAIPYAGFAENSVKKVLDRFYSMLNAKDSKLISSDDAFSWLNESYSITNSELNLVNRTYKVSDEYTITTAADTAEYAVPNDFSKVLTIYDESGKRYVDPIDLEEVPEWDSISGNTVRHYTRGDYIGFSPTPSSVKSYIMRYKTKTTALNSLYDNITLPDNAFYNIENFMLFKGFLKLKQKDTAQTFYDMFWSEIKRMKITSYKQGNNADSWGIDSTANV